MHIYIYVMKLCFKMAISGLAILYIRFILDQWAGANGGIAQQVAQTPR